MCRGGHYSISYSRKDEKRIKSILRLGSPLFQHAANELHAFFICGCNKSVRHVLLLIKDLFLLQEIIWGLFQEESNILQGIRRNNYAENV